VHAHFGNDENQRLHTFRHVIGAGLDIQAVQEAIEIDLDRVSLLDGLNKGKLELSGLALLYHAFKFPDGGVNVGRITIAESFANATDAKR
jgi:hypothetical protein